MEHNIWDINKTINYDLKFWRENEMAIMQEIETKLQKGISVSSNEEVY